MTTLAEGAVRYSPALTRGRGFEIAVREAEYMDERQAGEI
jgi:hypothetical protein